MVLSLLLSAPLLFQSLLQRAPRYMVPWLGNDHARQAGHVKRRVHFVPHNKMVHDQSRELHFRELPMPRYSLLPRHLEESLQGSEPTQDGDLTYYPCSTTLTNGDVLDMVYFMPERPAMKLWEGYLQADGAKRLIRVEEVAEIRAVPRVYQLALRTSLSARGIRHGLHHPSPSFL